MRVIALRRCGRFLSLFCATALCGVALSAERAPTRADVTEASSEIAEDGDYPALRPEGRNGDLPLCPPVRSKAQVCPPSEEPIGPSVESGKPSAESGKPAAESPSDRTAEQGSQPTSLEPEQFGGTGGQLAVTDAAGGYIDNAIVGSQFRFRADGMFDDTRPDRAEFVYAKCGCFRFSPPGGGPPPDPNAKGPGVSNVPEKRIDYQELNSYLELARSDRFSVFVEVPVRFVEFQVNSALDGGGVGDINAGFKYALIHDQDEYLTFQLRFYAPTGDSFEGLGTAHATIEPGLLFWKQCSDRLQIQGELRDWQPLGGSDFAGNVIRYGVGLGYNVLNPCCRCCDCCQNRDVKLQAVAEVVGWTVLSGMELVDDVGPVSAAGDTIVNLKLGPRLTWNRSSLYAGWGHAITGDAWYRDMVRLEYVHAF